MRNLPRCDVALYAGLAVAAAVCTLADVPAARAGPGDHIGATTLVQNLVTADYARDTRTLQVGDGVRQDERIFVGEDARSELHFHDDTWMALGPGSRVTLDRFVYDPDKAKGSIVVNMLKGTMRWVTGVASKPSYTIRVPNAAITVRGTTFDLFVTEVGETWLLLHEGAVQVCNSRGECRVHEESCKLTRVSGAGDVDRPVRWASLPGASDSMFHRAFPFVVIPPEFQPEPLCTRDGVTRMRDASAPPPAKPRKASAERVYKPTHAQAEPKPRRKPEYRKEAPVPKREVRVRESRRERVRYVERPRVRVVRREHYEERRQRRQAANVGRVLVGAAILGAAYVLTRNRGGGYGNNSNY